MDNTALLDWLNGAFAANAGQIDRQIQIAGVLAIVLQTKALVSMYEDAEYESRKKETRG